MTTWILKVELRCAVQHTRPSDHRLTRYHQKDLESLDRAFFHHCMAARKRMHLGSIGVSKDDVKPWFKWILLRLVGCSLNMLPQCLNMQFHSQFPLWRKGVVFRIAVSHVKCDSRSCNMHVPCAQDFREPLSQVSGSSKSHSKAQAQLHSIYVLLVYQNSSSMFWSNDLKSPGLLQSLPRQLQPGPRCISQKRPWEMEYVKWYSMV